MRKVLAGAFLLASCRSSCIPSDSYTDDSAASGDASREVLEPSGSASVRAVARYAPPRCKVTPLALDAGGISDAGAIVPVPASGSAARAWLLPIVRRALEVEVLEIGSDWKTVRSIWKHDGGRLGPPAIVPGDPEPFLDLSGIDLFEVKSGAPFNSDPVLVRSAEGFVRPTRPSDRQLAAEIRRGGRMLLHGRDLWSVTAASPLDAGVNPEMYIERPAEDAPQGLDIRALSLETGAPQQEMSLRGLGHLTAYELLPLAPPRHGMLVVYIDARSARVHGRGARLKRMVVADGKARSPLQLLDGGVSPEFLGVAVGRGEGSFWAYFSDLQGEKNFLPFAAEGTAALPSREPLLRSIAILGSIDGPGDLSLLGADLGPEKAVFERIQCER